jgi:hypothetical protein
MYGIIFVGIPHQDGNAVLGQQQGYDAAAAIRIYRPH